jgi:hypothetical protein
VSRVTEGIFEYPKQSHKIGEKWLKKSKISRAHGAYSSKRRGAPTECRF